MCDKGGGEAWKERMSCVREKECNFTNEGCR